MCCTKHDLKWAYLDGVMDKSDGDKFTGKHLLRRRRNENDDFQV